MPCTFLGKHLRFSPADLATIIASGSPTAPSPPTPPHPTYKAADIRRKEVDADQALGTYLDPALVLQLGPGRAGDVLRGSAPAECYP